MALLEIIKNFFEQLFAFFKGQIKITEQDSFQEETTFLYDANTLEQAVETRVDMIDLYHRTLRTKLYMFEQQIEVFNNEFPEKYAEFCEKIKTLRAKYDSYLQMPEGVLSIRIDPDISGDMNFEISYLEQEINNFINSEFEFYQLSKRLQVLIVKLNILYNVSISRPNEKAKVMSQVERALKNLTLIVSEFKECSYVLKDKQLRERITMLASYADYEIFKIVLRNSSFLPENLCQSLALVSFFKSFDFITAFRAFIEDELSDLGELLEFVVDLDINMFFKKRIDDLLKEFAYTSDLESKILSQNFWIDFFELESSLLEYLRGNNLADKDKIKVKVIVRMNINVREDEVLTVPKTNAYLSLISIYSTNHDERIWFLVKLFKNVSEEITYRQIYFLFLLFDVIELIKATNNSLSKYLEKYIKKYPYGRDEMKRKKIELLNSSTNKQYVEVLDVDEDVERVRNILEDLELDFEISETHISINSFYFSGIGNIFSAYACAQLP